MNNFKIGDEVWYFGVHWPYDHSYSLHINSLELVKGTIIELNVDGTAFHLVEVLYKASEDGHETEEVFPEDLYRCKSQAITEMIAKLQSLRD